MEALPPAFAAHQAELAAAEISRVRGKMDEDDPIYLGIVENINLKFKNALAVDAQQSTKKVQAFSERRAPPSKSIPFVTFGELEVNGTWEDALESIQHVNADWKADWKPDYRSPNSHASVAPYARSVARRYYSYYEEDTLQMVYLLRVVRVVEGGGDKPHKYVYQGADEPYTAEVRTRTHTRTLACILAYSHTHMHTLTLTRTLARTLAYSHTHMYSKRACILGRAYSRVHTRACILAPAYSRLHTRACILAPAYSHVHTEDHSLSQNVNLARDHLYGVVPGDVGGFLVDHFLLAPSTVDLRTQ